VLLKMFAILDRKVAAYRTPFFMHHRGQAVRAFTDLANDMQTDVGRHPADFVLVELALFDDATGKIADTGALEVVTALELVREENVALPLGVPPRRMVPPSVRDRFSNGTGDGGQE